MSKTLTDLKHTDYFLVREEDVSVDDAAASDRVSVSFARAHWFFTKFGQIDCRGMDDSSFTSIDNSFA